MEAEACIAWLRPRRKVAPAGTHADGIQRQPIPNSLTYPSHSEHHRRLGEMVGSIAVLWTSVAFNPAGCVIL